LQFHGVPHAGIAYCHLKSRNLNQIAEMLVLMHELLTQEEMVRRVQFL
jgi:hypothetical protein